MIESPRLSIRKIDEAQVQQIAETIDDDTATTSYLQSLPEDVLQDIFQDSQAILDFIQSLTSLRNSSDTRQYGAWTHEGELVAYAGLTSWSSETPELQLIVAKEYQNCGYGTEFMQYLIPWLFQHKHIKFFVYRLRKDNTFSERIVQKLDGILQKPHSRLEEMTIKTYHIPRH